MSYSTPNEKYRKYEELLSNNPNNETYKRKVHKYRALSLKMNGSIQIGGNTQSNEEFKFDALREMAGQQPLNQKQYMGNTKSDGDNRSRLNSTELVKKINNLVAYAQETGMQMDGGANKKNKNTQNKTTSIKGYRLLGGGSENETINDLLKRSLPPIELPSVEHASVEHASDITQTSELLNDDLNVQTKISLPKELNLLHSKFGKTDEINESNAKNTSDAKYKNTNISFETIKEKNRIYKQLKNAHNELLEYIYTGINDKQKKEYAIKLIEEAKKIEKSLEKHIEESINNKHEFEKVSDHAFEVLKKYNDEYDKLMERYYVDISNKTQNI